MNLARNILATFGSRLILLGLALIGSIMAARFLGPEGRGLLALVLLLPDFAKTLGLFGFDQANAVYAGLEPGRRRALVGQSAVIGFVLGSIIALACAAWLAFGAVGMRAMIHGPLWLYMLPLATIPTVLVAQYWGAVLHGMNRIVLINTVDVVIKSITLVLFLVFVGSLRLGVVGAVWSDAIMSVADLFITAYLLIRLNIGVRPSFDTGLFIQTARFALPAYFSTVLTYLNYRVDQFIIAVLLTPIELGYYVIAVGIAERLWMLTGAVAGPLLPHLTNSPDRDPAVAAVASRHVLVWMGAACLLVFVFCDVAIRLLYSAEFMPTVAPLRWLLPGIFTLSVGKVLVAELLARKKVMFTLSIAIVAAALNITGNLILIPTMGISGAAVASTISYTISSALLAWCYVRETRLPWVTLVPRCSDLRIYVTLARNAMHLGVGRTPAIRKVQS